MDLRTKKTRRSIKNAFLQLRAKKDIERITVKELSDLAEISKATFYLHYHDIYDLSSDIEKELIQTCLEDIQHPEYLHDQTGAFTQELVRAFHAHQSLIDIVFSGSRASFLPISIEKTLKDYMFQIYPDLKDNADYNILLTYQILGGYFAYNENLKQFGIEKVTEMISRASIQTSLILSEIKRPHHSQ